MQKEEPTAEVYWFMSWHRKFHYLLNVVGLSIEQTAGILGIEKTVLRPFLLHPEPDPNWASGDVLKIDFLFSLLTMIWKKAEYSPERMVELWQTAGAFEVCQNTNSHEGPVSLAEYVQAEKYAGVLNVVVWLRGGGADL